jgi:hypothetical protein
MTTRATQPETVPELRRQIADERERLTSSIESLREKADLGAQLKAKLNARLPVLVLAAFGAAFVLGGGLGATMRLVFRRQREGKQTARIGRLVLLDRS